MRNDTLIFSPFVIGAAAGIVVAMVLYASFLLFERTFGELELLLWPASILLAAFTGAPWKNVLPVLALSVGLNALLYGILGAVAGMVLRRLGLLGMK
jgi:hypothetical protein